MTKSQLVAGSGGRSFLKKKGEPDRVALPLHVADGAIAPSEKDVLLRFIDASEMAKGNISVITIDGQPRGRFAKYAERVTATVYSQYEIAAYRWILSEAFGKESMTIAEIFARLSGDRADITTLELGKFLSGSENHDIAMGAIIGTVRSLAWALKDAYRDYQEFWAIRENAASQGRALTDDETARRVRRRMSVRKAFEGYRPQIVDNTRES